MNLLVLVVAVVLCALAQALLPSWEFLGGAKPPVLLGAVIYYALVRPRGLAVTAALLAGLLQDSLDQIPLGFSAWTFCVLAILVTHYQRKIFGNHWVTHMMLGAAASAGMVFTLYALLLTRGTLERPLSSAVAMALGVMVLGLFVIPLVFKLVERLDHIVGNLEPRGWT
jgi:rod shape-determining protein MreD